MAAMSTQLATARPAAVAAAVPAPDDPRLGAWRAFLHAHARLLRRLDEELQAEHGLSLAEYDALLQLANAPGRRLRMSVLAERVLLSRSGITRLVDRLEASGMVGRTACVTDARGAEAELTPAGLDRLREASRTHLGGVERYFLAPVADDDRASVERAANGILDGLGRGQLLDASCTVESA
jgi:DNA-binding MarR family transcriptional regulator